MATIETRGDWVKTLKTLLQGDVDRARERMEHPERFRYRRKVCECCGNVEEIECYYPNAKPRKDGYGFQNLFKKRWDKYKEYTTEDTTDEH